MATTTDTTGTSRPTLFLRNATGLVKAWSTFDAFLYAFWSVSLVGPFFPPLPYTLGWSGLATFRGSHTGIFVSCLIVLGFVSWVITLGMEGYARIQRFCFWLGMAGLLAMLGILLFSSHEAFVS